MSDALSVRPGSTKHRVRNATAGALIAAALSCAPVGDETDPTDAWITIRDARVRVEVARGKAQQSLGLGDRDSLAWNRGMLFSYSDPGFYTFWMKRMRFDIDIVWIRNEHIVDLSLRVPHEVSPPLPKYTPRELVDTVLEVPAGYAEAHGWRRGDAVHMEMGP